MDDIIKKLNPQDLESIRDWANSNKTLPEIILLIQKNYEVTLDEESVRKIISEKILSSTTPNLSNNKNDSGEIIAEQQSLFSDEKVVRKEPETKQKRGRPASNISVTQVKTDLDKMNDSLSSILSEIESLKQQNLNVIELLRKKEEDTTKYLLSIDELIRINSSKRARTSINLNKKLKEAITEKTSKNMNFSDIINDLLLKAFYKKS